MSTAWLVVWTVAGCAAAGPLAAQAPAPDGKVLYEKNCRACHGARGTPPAVLAKQQNIPRWDASFMADRTDDSLVAAIRNGGKNMKGFSGKLSPDEMAAIAGYIRELVPPKPAP